MAVRVWLRFANFEQKEEVGNGEEKGREVKLWMTFERQFGEKLLENILLGLLPRSLVNGPGPVSV